MSNKITSYSAACTYLDDMQMHKIKLGLDAVRGVLAALGSPEQKCPAVHVAGTNGKGSVCSMLQSVLTEAGYRCGLYTSPHLSSVRERFRIGEKYISEDEFTEMMERVRSSLNGRSITYFECATALAFSWFADSDCDLVIIETGMGGRLDATNVLIPLISVITTISMDHEQYLGDTIEAVAYEKAGIIKPGVPLISGVTDGAAARVIEAAAAERGAPAAVRDRDFSLTREQDGSWTWKGRAPEGRISGLTVTSRGDWQAENCSCAVAAAIALRGHGFRLEDHAVINGIARTYWPGRMEPLDVACRTEGGLEKHLHFLMDGAHNEAGVMHLVRYIERCEKNGRVFLVWASMSDKTYQQMLKKIASSVDYLLFTRPDSERSATASELAETVGGVISPDCIHLSSGVEEAYRKVCAEADDSDLVIVAGSLYLVGAFRKLLVGEVVP